MSPDGLPSELVRYRPQRKRVAGRYRFLTPEGDLVPGVTTVLSATDPPEKKWRLADWRRQELAAGRDPNRHARRGTWLHRQVEQALGSPGFEPEASEFRPFWESLQPELARLRRSLLVESLVWHPDGYAGTLDCLAICDRGRLMLFDWKSAEAVKPDAWLENYRLQLGAYLPAVEWVYRDLGLRVEAAALCTAIPGQPAQRVEYDRAAIAGFREAFRVRLAQYRRLQAN